MGHGHPAWTEDFTASCANGHAEEEMVIESSDPPLNAIYRCLACENRTRFTFSESGQLSGERLSDERSGE